MDGNKIHQDHDSASDNDDDDDDGNKFFFISNWLYPMGDHWNSRNRKKNTSNNQFSIFLNKYIPGPTCCAHPKPSENRYWEWSWIVFQKWIMFDCEICFSFSIHIFRQTKSNKQTKHEWNGNKTKKYNLIPIHSVNNNDRKTEIYLFNQWMKNLNLQKKTGPNIF